MSTEVHRRRRRAPRGRGAAPHWLGRLPYAIVLCGVAGGLVLCALDYFRKGSGLMAAAVLFGALARLVLPPSQAGMLETRSRWVDVTTMTVLAVAIATTAAVVPHP
ncbi:MULTISPECIES: DUF3017 domain-containing protein [Actinomadura]|uniref:DUF3017 domain-containing protein n=2 Tax=Actinomadura TaxID=1988 RepID=A0A2P4UQ85_9ACTN|nr:MULTISPECIES: DUF3017 domain-containing protein [Actinomadura]MXQ64404.1 DUF3017 domain-containing protein [Actinomadura rayongensis]POM27208.1 hypothetical protein BTM25_16190 [Actinomadura rubteroloni]